MKDYSEAIDLFKESIEFCRRNNNLRSMSVYTHNLAYALDRAGRAKEALPLFVENVETSKSLFGVNSVELYLAIGNLAKAQFNTLSLAAAVRSAKESCDGFKKLLGDEHLSTLNAQGNLAVFMMMTGDLKKSQFLMEKALAGLKATVGLNHSFYQMFVGYLDSYTDPEKIASILQFASEASALQAASEADGRKMDEKLAKYMRAETSSESKEMHAQVFASVTGIKSRPELNSCKVQVLELDTNTTRYSVREVSTNATMNLKPTNLILDAGTHIMVVGLESAPELNGSLAIVQRFDPARARYDIIKVEGGIGCRKASVRPEKCQPVLGLKRGPKEASI